MRISNILRTKGSMVVTIHPDRTVLDAVQTLVQHNIGATVVVEGDRVVGILSERDVLRLTADGPALVESARVSDVMTSELVTAAADEDLVQVMDKMTSNRVRHLPIMAEGTLVGLVSIGDVVNALLNDSEEMNRQLRAYITGSA